MEEAIEWVRRCPDPMPGEESVIEIRPVLEADDFGKEFTPDLRAQEERVRAEAERQRKFVAAPGGRSAAHDGQRDRRNAR
jgi:hypothetical protein